MDEFARTEAVNVANEEIASKHQCQRQFWDRVRLLHNKENSNSRFKSERKLGQNKVKQGKSNSGLKNESN